MRLDFTARNLAVVGDIALDRYVEGPVDRISPEAPVAVSGWRMGFRSGVTAAVLSASPADVAPSGRGAAGASRQRRCRPIAPRPSCFAVWPS